MSKTKIAILGAGPGGLSAAFHLAAQERDDLEITVYTMGWRVGGKGAAGRNFEHSERIEEHGIHLFGNFYPNTFDVMNRCRDVTREEFIPSNLQIMTEWYRKCWHLYPTRYAHVGEEPWETVRDDRKLDEVVNVAALPDKLAESILAILGSGWQLGTTRARRAFGNDAAPEQRPWPPRQPSALGAALGRLIAKFVRRLGRDMQRTDGYTNEAVPVPPPGSRPIHPYPPLLRACMFCVRQLARLSPRIRYQYQQVDLLLAAMHGFNADDLGRRGIDAIDGWGHREWLHHHGISDMTLNSAVVSAAPSICLQFPAGDSTTSPNMSAAAYLTFVLRQVLASGNAFHFFRAGTGETVFLPWYRKLIELGVKFEFFHKAADVVPAADGETIERIEFEIQARGRNGAYDPLCTTSDGQLVWDANTPYDKLERGDEMRARGVNLESWWADWAPVGHRTLRCGEDFDQVVMAIPVGAHPWSCPTLVEEGPAAGPAGKTWKQMVEGLETIPSQAVQIWLKQDMGAYGMDPAYLTWRGERFAGPSFELPLNLWTDFSDLIPIENWQGTVPKTLIYWCGPLQDEAASGGAMAPFDDHGFPATQRERIRWSAAMSMRNLGSLLPGATAPWNRQGLDFEELVCDVDDDELVGEMRLSTQHLRANIDPNERYVISKPGHLPNRRQAWESGYANMALAGDWIFTGINIGSFEGSVMSGKLASHALTGSPGLDEVWGYAFLRNRVEGGNVPLIPAPQGTGEV
ncbi:MAG TPA: NAD(P)-binding protein [Pseudomonadales bacterium]|nr:NAD(P)-binding protein [Pseudomonadales bacterium]